MFRFQDFDYLTVSVGFESLSSSKTRLKRGVNLTKNLLYLLFFMVDTVVAHNCFCDMACQKLFRNVMREREEFVNIQAPHF